MASYFFLRGEFENVMIYFTSIKGFFFNDDSFNFNFAQAKAILGSYAEAEEVNVIEHGVHGQQSKKKYYTGVFADQQREH